MWMRVCSAAIVAATMACAHAGQRRSTELPGTYRFSDLVLGLGNVSGSFEVSESGRVTSIKGGCSERPALNADALSSQCRIQRLSIMARDDSTVRSVAVRVVVTETIPSASNPTATQTRSRTYTGTVAAYR
jgi:hypothetical protein